MTVQLLSDGTQQASFSYDFTLDQKSLDHTVDENGDMWIEGYASDWGLDRQEEAFEPGAFERGLKAFLETNPIMLFHHQYDKALGQFTEARVDGNGLWVRGRVDAPARGSWAEDVFAKIKRGTIKSFSVGGLFRRRMTPKGPRIYDCDLGEISVTPFPVNPRTTFAVAAKKAFDSPEIKAVAETVEEAAETETVPSIVEGTPSETEAVATETEPVATETEPSGAVIEDGTITAEKIAQGSITVEHLSDDLRSRVQEFSPEAESEEVTQEELAQLTERLSAVFDQLGVKFVAPVEEEAQN